MGMGEGKNQHWQLEGEKDSFIVFTQGRGDASCVSSEAALFLPGFVSLLDEVSSTALPTALRKADEL